MVDQPGAGASRSYKIRGHTRQRRTTKPYARPSEVKKKGLLDTVKDYLSPSWLFSYFQKDEAEESSDSEEEMNEDEEDPRLNDKRSSPEYNVTRIENSTETPPIIEDNNSIFEHEDKTRNIVSPPSQLAQEDSRVSDKDNFRSSLFSENNNKGERWIHSGMSSRLSGELEDDEDEIDILQTSKHITETEQPQHSVLSYSSQQLKRRPLPSILHSRTPTSTLFQHRNTPMIRSQGNSLLSLMATTTNTTSFSSQPSNVLSSRTNTRTTAASSSTTTSSDPWKRSQPVAPISSAPGFSVSTFVTPVPRVFTKRRTESPFYPGTVTYGGALSQSGYTSKRQRRNSPSSEICQPVRKQQIRAKPLPNAVHGGATSQTAQRILEALESVSSPLKDVRRIPSPLPSLTASPLSFSPTKLRTKPPRSKVGPRVSSLQAKLLGGPPVEVLSAPQNAKVSSINVSEAYHPKTMSTPLPPSDNPLTRQTADRSQTLFSGLKDTVLKTSLPTFFTPKSLPTSLSPVEKTTKASGKMRSASRGVSHYSAKNNEDDYQVVNPLPEIVHAVPLPVNPSKNMSSLFKSSQVDHSKSSLKKAENNNNNKPLENHPAIMEKFVSESSKNGFIFSKPKQHIVSVKEALSMADDEVSFSFSQPVSVKTMAMKDIKADSAKDLSKKSPLASEKCSNDVKTLEVHSGTNLSETRSSLANMFGSAPGEWDCLMCMIRNKASVDICVACSSARPNKKKTEESEKKSKEEPSKASSSDLAKQFAPVEGSWDCETCSVNNKASELTCVACSTAKPGATESGSRDQRSLGVDLKAKFAAPANTWDCEVCMIRNTIEHDKCAACETKRPGSTATDENELKSKFAAPPGSWSCETCMIRNKSSDVKCVACETAKPGSESNTGFGQSVFNLVSSSSNGNTKSSSSSSGFTFGSNAVTTSTVPSFTFGKGTSEETKPSFTFGNSSATTETPKSEFKFGVNSTSEQETAPKFTFGVPQNNKPETGFGFGAKGSDTKSSPVTTDQNKAVSNINSVKTAGSGPLNIAQAAAAGLLQVPGLNDITPSSKQAATSQPAFQLQVSNSLPLFTNGSTSFGAPPKNVPDSSTVAAPPKENTPAPATTSSASVKIIPFSFGGVVPPPASVSSSTTTVPDQTPLGNAVSNQIGNLPVSKAQASFNFSAQSSNKKNNGKPSFSFGDSTTASKDSSGATFKFGATTEVQSNAVTKTSSLFPTSTASGSTATADMFSFTGSGGSTVDKPKTTQFNFGAMNGPSSSTGTSTTQSQNTGNALFNFSAGQPSNPDNENQNSLGGEEMDADSNNNNDNGQSSFAPAAPAPAGFNFTPGGFSFGSGGATTIPSNFQFGTPSSTTNNNNNTPSGGFSFVPSAAVPAGSSPFVFGGQSTAAASVPANVPSASSAGFSFGAPAANTPTPSFNFGQTTSSAPQPAAFNIGAAQNTPASTRVIKRGIRRTRR